MSDKIVVVGQSTGRGDIETWHFDNENDPSIKGLCEILARDTCRTVYVIKGEVIGSYQIAGLPIYYKEKLTGKMDNIREASFIHKMNEENK